MDTSDPNIVFDKYGICNHCNRQILWKSNEFSKIQKKEILDNEVKKIKLLGKKSDYDCLIGLSGVLTVHM